MTDEPFGRQPKPVKVTITGENAADVLDWIRHLSRAAEYKGDNVQMGTGHHYLSESTKEFTIYPRAVND